MAKNIYQNRQQAGQILADLLRAYRAQPGTIVLALPRGGVPIGYEIAKKLHLPWDIYLVRKLGVPGDEELAMGAIAMNGEVFLNPEIINNFQISQKQIEQVVAVQKQELKRRNQLYRHNRPLPELQNQTIILVDDGLATGATMLAAIQALKSYQPAEIIVAVPVGAEEICDLIEQKVDALICPLKPVELYGVGNWYQDFHQMEDDEVISFLKY